LFTLVEVIFLLDVVNKSFSLLTLTDIIFLLILIITINFFNYLKLFIDRIFNQS